MNLYNLYLAEIEDRKKLGLKPKPIDDGALISELIELIKDSKSEHRADALKYLIYNTLPGTTSAANEKAEFLKEIILENNIEGFFDEICSQVYKQLTNHSENKTPIEIVLFDFDGNVLARYPKQ